MKHESLNPTGIPDELKRTHRWVLWQLCDVTEHGKLRKSCKVPFDAKSGSPASHSDFETWATFEVALAAHESNLKLTPPANIIAMHETRGIGMVLGPPFFGKDFDKCIVDGVIDPEVEAELEELNTFAEISQSGSGVHVIGHGEPPYPEGHRKDDREIYSCNRFFVMTGNVIGDYKEVRRFTPVEVAAMYAKVKAGCSEKVAEGRTIATSAKLEELMTRTDYPDLSPMVQSLLTLLAIKHTLKEEKVVEEFKQSAIYNETHWKEKWERLGPQELAKAIEYARENIAKRRESGAKVTRELTVLTARKSDRKPQIMMWDPVLAQGKLTHCGGPSSVGKSPVTLDIMARLSRGEKWPDDTPITCGPKHSILLNIEDAWEDIILPRYFLAGGVEGLLHLVPGVKVSSEDPEYEMGVAFDTDFKQVSALARKLAATPEGLGIICVDPVTNYLGKLKMNSEEQMRAFVLTPLAKLAEELKCCVLTIGHQNKGESKDPKQRMMGASAFVGVARSVLAFARNEKGGSPYHHYFVPIRGELFDSFQYHTEVVKETYDGVESKVVKVVWDGRGDQKAEDTTADLTPSQQTKDQKECADALHQFLLSGKQPATACKAFLKENGWDIDALNSGRVRKIAKVNSKQKDRKWWWFLPERGELFEPTPEREKRSEELKQDDAPTF